MLADRVHQYNAPLHQMYAALTVNRSWWLRLQPGEIQPQVLEAIPQHRVVWSSFWPVSPNDTIEFDLSFRGETFVRFPWSTDSPPDERGINITRQRLNLKFGGDIRAVVSEYHWHGR